MDNELPLNNYKQHQNQGAFEPVNQRLGWFSEATVYFMPVQEEQGMK